MTLLTSLLAVIVAGCSEEQAASPATTKDVSAPLSPADPDWRAAIDDWYDNGLFDKRHDCAAVRELGSRLPTGGRAHSTVHDDLAAYADLVCTDTRRPSAPVTLVHRYLHPLPYPAGPRYNVSLRRAGAFRGVRWSRFANDALYTRSGVTGEARFASVLLPSRRYVVTSSTTPCADANDGCRTIGKAQARCARTVDLAGHRPVVITIIVRNHRDACRISIDR